MRVINSSVLRLKRLSKWILMRLNISIKQICLVMILSLAAAVCLEGILCTRSNVVRLEELPTNKENLFLEGESYVSGYDYTNATYIPNNDDPQIGFELPGINSSVIIVEFGEPLSEDTLIEVYYAVNGEMLSEENHVEEIVTEGSDVAVFSLSEAAYSHIRVDINGKFDLGGIYSSLDNPQVDENSLPFNIGRIVFIWILLCALMIIFISQRSIICISNPDKSEQKNQSARIMASVLLMLFLCGIIFATVSGNVGFFAEREIYLALVILFAVAVFVSVNSSPIIAYIFVIALGAFWLLLDYNLDPIDEWAHLYIVNYIIENHHFPLVQENYEAVQGPVYYYTMAVLFYMIPMKYMYIACRLAGLGCLIAFGFISRHTIIKLYEHKIINVDIDLQNVIWLLFVANPLILIRMTRVSNESLAILLSGIILHKVVCLILDGFDNITVFACTVLCGVTFLTKATTVFLFGGVIIVCIYYKKWKVLLSSFSTIVLIALPWFLSNYAKYGALTGMEAHLEFALPIVNPDRVPPDLFGAILNFFDTCFFDPVLGCNYNADLVVSLLGSLCLFLFFAAVIFSFKKIIIYLKAKCAFIYSKEERSDIIAITLTALPAAGILVHCVSALMTDVNSLHARYFLILNGGFAALLLMGLSHIKKDAQPYITGFFSTAFSIMTFSLIGGYIDKFLP